MSKLVNELLALKNDPTVTADDPIDTKTIEEKAEWLRHKKINRAYSTGKRVEMEIAKTQNLDLRTIPDNFYEDLQAKAKEIRQAQKVSMPFITAKLTELVPLSFPNLITIGATSGSGKTTAAANITFQLYKNGQRVLILSNEELSLDVLDRISCMELGYDVNKRSTFTDEQNAELDKLRPIVGEFVRVVDTTYAGNPQLTCSVEGIDAILKSLEKQEAYYDCIILDYYQKVTISKENPNQNDHETLMELSNILDKAYKVVKAPIVVMCQLHPSSKEANDFEKRIKSGKSIMMVSTCVVELERVEGVDYASDWICHKDRWGKSGKTVRTTWIKGKFKDT